jgi:hypothetical protein
MAKSLLDEIGIEKVNKMFREATERAAAKTLAAGRPVTRDVDGVTSKVYPDGRVEPARPTKEAHKKKLAA